jgi:hypothetical protein
MKWFNVIHHDGAIRIEIGDDGHAIVDVKNINDDEVLVRAINRAFQEGARSGSLFTGEVVNDQMARMHTMRAEKGRTWLGGKVTRLAERSPVSYRLGDVSAHYGMRLPWQSVSTTCESSHQS